MFPYMSNNSNFADVKSFIEFMEEKEKKAKEHQEKKDKEKREPFYQKNTFFMSYLMLVCTFPIVVAFEVASLMLIDKWFHIFPILTK